MTLERWDAVVVGAGPAGALTARELARAGHSVLLVDRDSVPRWKVCGACLGGAGSAALARAGLGDLPSRLGARAVDRLRIRGWGRDVVLGVEGSVALSRRALDGALVEAAASAGAEVRTECTASLDTLGEDARGVLLRSQGRSQRVEARVVVDATGLASLRRTPAAGPGPPVRVREDSRIGVGAIFAAGAGPPHGRWEPEPGTVVMAVGDAGYVGTVVLEDGGVDVAGALDLAWVRRWGDPGRAVLELMDRAGVPLPRGTPVEGWRGTPPLTRTPSRHDEPRVFRVGDAAGYVEPFTGEGMSWALEGALALAPLAGRAVSGWTPELAAAWQRTHHERVGRRQRVCRGVAWLSRRGALARAVLGLLERAPVLARPWVRAAAAPPPLPSSVPPPGALA